jgi:hypothetical protein
MDEALAISPLGKAGELVFCVLSACIGLFASLIAGLTLRPANGNQAMDQTRV